jgi:hypothetical protein
MNGNDPSNLSASSPPSIPSKLPPQLSAPTENNTPRVSSKTPSVLSANSSIGTEYPIPYLWFIVLLSVCIGIFAAIEWGANLSDIQNKWPEYRCQPHIMPFASIFGQDTNENFQFCLQQIIQEKTKGVTAPFAQGMFGFTGVLTNLMESANSFRTMLATLVGGVIKIVNEFQNRMTALMGRVKLTASRMKAMMFRVYGTMFAVVYMGLSAQTGIANFGDTFIFKFIDSFCFPPDQELILESGERMLISDIIVGDVLMGGHRVESTYMFIADGQPMVNLGGIEVSSNHLVASKGIWVMAKDHPDAIPVKPWIGGSKRPLICLTTHDHIMDIGPYIFADYDETDKGNQPTQQWVHSSLNGLPDKTPYMEVSYDVGVEYSEKIKIIGGEKPAVDIVLGDRLTEKSRVVGILNSEVTEICVLPNGSRIATGTLVYNTETSQWLRACTMYPVLKLKEPIDIIALFVSPGASYELTNGTRIRDAMEIYSPETKRAYTDSLLGKPVEF